MKGTVNLVWTHSTHDQTQNPKTEGYYTREGKLQINRHGYDGNISPVWLLEEDYF